MLNHIWLGLIVAAVALGAATGRIEEVTRAALESAGGAVTIAIGLIGAMSLWLGIMKIAEDAGLVRLLARLIAPILRRLFPDVPADHPAMGSMLLNIAANALGLSNAATPLGLRAMEDLERLNPTPGIATNAMCTFLTINTAGVQIIPASMVSLMASAGSKDPSAIIGTTFAATLISLVLGLAMAKLLERLPVFSVDRAARQEKP
jgi:spore maturation protein A